MNKNLVEYFYMRDLNGCLHVIYVQSHWINGCATNENIKYIKPAVRECIYDDLHLPNS